MSLDVTLLTNYCICCTRGDEVYDANITHNLNKMAEAADIYYHLWRPDEIQIITAEQLIKPLTKGLKKLKKDPVFYKAYNPENGWGSYEVLVRFAEDYLQACKKYPDAMVEVSR